MDHLVLQVVLLYITLCFCPLQSQGNNVVFPLTFHNVSEDLVLQQLVMEWDVDDEAYNSEKQIIFNIQINQTGATNVVWNKNYTITLSKSHRPIRWKWPAEEPMECMLYAVRIRSLVISEDVPVPESWSDWTEWKEVKGIDIEDSKFYVFPKNKVFDKGSNISFCCIGKKEEKVSSFYFGLKTYPAGPSHRRVVFPVKDSSLSNPQGTIVACTGSNSSETTMAYVTRPPGKPKDLSCETEDMETLNCAWTPGSIDNLEGKHSIHFILSDKSTGKEYCHQRSSEENRCSFKIGTQTAFNLKLEAKNALGKRQTNLSFEVAHRVHPAPPSALRAFAKNSTAIELRWNVKHKLELLCQIESHHPYGTVDLHNSTSYSTYSYIVNGLKPYTKYEFRVHCATNRHFWKWSNWSEQVTIWTKESAPSGYLDVWRSISPEATSFCNITVFWKPFPDFSANGKIIAYKIFLEELEKRPVSWEVPASHNSTVHLLHNCSCKISVSAKNSVNLSSPSVISLSEASENDHNIRTSKEDTVNNTQTGIYISWKPQSQFDSYIVDWCNHPRVQPCDFQWKKFGKNQSSALIISDAFVAGVQYSFRVYGSHGNTASLLEKKTKYLKELEPDSFPKLHVDTANSRWLTLTWDYDYLNESLPGFIRGYTVFVKDKDGNCTLEGPEKPIIQGGSVICRYTVKDPTQKMLTVKHPGLKKDYLLGVLAFSTRPPDFMDDTIMRNEAHVGEFDSLWVFQLLAIPAVISVILLICICFWRSKCIENRCCPKIPYPIVGPFKIPEMHPTPLVEPSDFTPNDVLVEEYTLQPWSREEKNSNYNQGLHAEMPAVETLTFQNLPYFTDGSNCYRNLPTLEASSQKPELTLGSYKPLLCFAPLSNLTNINNASQKDISFPGVPRGDLAGPIDSSKQFDYKPHPFGGSESSSPDTSEENIGRL